MIADNAWIDALLRMAVIALAMPLSVIVLNYVERKVIGRIQMRLGPMRVGPYGSLQTIADTIKLLTKEDLRPASADRWTFELAPYAVVVPTFLAFVTLPITDDLYVRNLPLGLFFILAVSSMSIVGIVMAGWGSDNKYALLGGVRAAAQLISYEIPLVLAVVSVAMIASTDVGRGSLDLGVIVDGQGRVPNIVWQSLPFFLFFVATLAELYRQPFDIPVAESEVVGGPFVEYSGIRWSMFQLAEYVNLVLFSILGSLVFLGGWNWPMGNDVGWGLQLALIVIKSFAFIMIFFLVRVALPRLRIDQLMAYCWQILIPFAFLQIIINGFVVVYDWPDWLLGVLSGASTAAVAYLTYRGAQQKAEPYSPRYTAARIEKVAG
ncbi:MAG TPA: NADH-quinone oxidoreductase subunit NuoH [Dehalococcoidia bacterium]|nr:NADH-quinone oxidoreductase subunit NuoH [Dehalococcoidia bacterium]